MDLILGLLEVAFFFIVIMLMALVAGKLIQKD